METKVVALKNTKYWRVWRKGKNTSVGGKCGRLPKYRVETKGLFRRIEVFAGLAGMDSCFKGSRGKNASAGGKCGKGDYRSIKSFISTSGFCGIKRPPKYGVRQKVCLGENISISGNRGGKRRNQNCSKCWRRLRDFSSGYKRTRFLQEVD